LPALRKGADYGGENCQIISFVLDKIKALKPHCKPIAERRENDVEWIKFHSGVRHSYIWSAQARRGDVLVWIAHRKHSGACRVVLLS
jgi:hypothetical protein